MIRGKWRRRLALVGLGIGVVAAGASAQTPPRPHIILILIDTLRADHLGAYGYARDTSPSLDALASQGLLFENYQSTAPWTNPAIVSLFTGRYPQSVLPAAEHARAIRQSLPTDLTTLAEALAQNGYATAALVDHPGINPELHFDQGFAEFIHLFKKGGVRYFTLTDSEFVFGEIDAQLGRMNPLRPTFLYLHLVYPHRPYGPPPPYDTMFGPAPDKITRTQRDRVVNIYDGEIRYTDDLIGRVVERMRDLNLLEQSVVIVTADHGEGFWEHGLSEHGNSFYSELLRVPLIIRPPADHPMRRGRDADLASSVDLYATVLELADVAPAEGVESRSLLDAQGSPANRRSVVFSESPHEGDLTAMSSIGTNRKYIRSDNWKHELFDLRNDPGERDNRLFSIDLFGDDLWQLRDSLADHVERTQRERQSVESNTVEPDADTQERLRALGYVD